MSSQSPEYALLDLEEKLLTLVEEAWNAYEDSEAPMPPMNLVNIITKAHGVIAQRLKQKLGGTFDPNRPEEALIEIEKIRALILRQLEQKRRLAARVS
jgi:hypothetical protein